MNKLLEDLEQIGAQPRKALGRLFDDETFYSSLLRKFLDKRETAELREKLCQKDYATAYRIAHTMKGSASILELTPMLNALSNITSRLSPFYDDPKRTATETLEKEVCASFKDVERCTHEYLALLKEKA